jgi:small conductance mechanosensitive channel
MLNQQTIDKIIDLVLSYLPKLALALVTLFAGLWLIKMFVKFLGRLMTARKIDESLKPFLSTLVKIILTVLLMISVMDMIGIEMTSFIALLGAVGIAIGMALSGSLQHFAGGVLLMIYKPFKRGDFIEAQDQKGTVREVGIFNTIINTVDNKTVFIPNGPLSTGTIVNYTTEDTRRVDLVFGISYKDDIDKAKKILETIMNNDQRILKEPAPVIGVAELAASSVNIALRVWTANADYFDIEFYLKETVKKEFDKQNITIPFPQMDVNVKSSVPGA